MSSHALQDPTAPVIRTSLDKTAASTAQGTVKDQVVANKATVDSDLMRGTTDLAHKLAQQGVGRKTAGGAQQVGLHALCHYLLVSSALAAQQGVGRKTAGGAQQVGLHAVYHYLLVSSALAAQQGVGQKKTAGGAQQVVLHTMCQYLLVLWLHKIGLCSHGVNANKDV